jgi:hypothetical protein
MRIRFANILAATMDRRAAGGTGKPQLIVVPVVDRDQLPSALYRLERERRYIPPGTAPEVPVGIRSP